jgi:SAM-dependent methyltransferase
MARGRLSLVKQIEDSPSYHFAEKFYFDLFEELEFHKRSRKYLTFGEYKFLKSYYPQLNCETVNYTAKYYARLLMHAGDCLAISEGSGNVLDAGCGLGSESLFFGLIGANIFGVELSKEMLSIAVKRVRYYEDKYGKTLNVVFSNKSILRFCNFEKFDLVWCNQAISHIDPVQPFFENAWKNLKHGGHLIISDSNGLNPLIALNAARVHLKHGTYTQVKDPETQQQISFAFERMLAPVFLKAYIKAMDNKFENPRLTKWVGFSPPQLGIYRMFRLFDGLMSNTPLIKAIGATYIIIFDKI